MFAFADIQDEHGKKALDDGLKKLHEAYPDAHKQLKMLEREANKYSKQSERE